MGLETDNGKTISVVLDELRASGYRVAYRLYNSGRLLPQKRKRVYIVAIRSDLQEACAAFRFPWLPDLHRCVGEVLEAAPAEEESLRMTQERWQKIRSSRAFRETPGDILGPLDALAAPLVSSYGKGSCGQYARYTQLIAGATLDEIPRRFSRRECARLQGFPEEFTSRACDGPRAWYRLIGNAVSPPVVSAIAGALLCALQHPGRESRLPGTGCALWLATNAAAPEVRETLYQKQVSVSPGREATVEELLRELGYHTIT